MRRLIFLTLTALVTACATTPAPIDELHATLAQTYRVPTSQRAPFLNCMRETGSRARLPNTLSRSAYEKTGELNELSGPDWSFLILWDTERVEDLALARTVEAQCANVEGVVLLRSEIMTPTPASFHPAASNAPRRPDLAFIVEFIAVEETPASLNEYRETMRTSIGPAVGRLVREQQFYMMIGLETREVLAHNEAFRWNQIHIRGVFPEFGPTPPSMTAYMEEADPDRGGFASVFARLDAIRPKPQDALAHEQVDLRL
jgi:hypothetical protein